MTTDGLYGVKGKKRSLLEKDQIEKKRDELKKYVKQGYDQKMNHKKQ
jgi:hypothetical protein